MVKFEHCIWLFEFSDNQQKILHIFVLRTLVQYATDYMYIYIIENVRNYIPTQQSNQNDNGY